VTNDGWASTTTGTTGGAKADAAHVRTVSDRQQLVAALADPTDGAAKTVYIKGTIDGNVDDANKPMRCEDYATAGYTLDAYLKAYDPATFGRTKRPSGAPEEARAASQKKQAARVQLKVSPNTTIVGVDGARLVGVNLVVDQVDNVIIRNLTFVDAYDCFPQWDPTDGSQGNWNSQYDNISLYSATHVWIDHNAFGDGDHPDTKQPSYFARPYQIHDGQLDIAKASDLVTVSWNRFADHDKVMLIGSSDTATADAGKLNATRYRARAVTRTHGALASRPSSTRRTMSCAWARASRRTGSSARSTGSRCARSVRSRMTARKRRRSTCSPRTTRPAIRSSATTSGGRRPCASV